MFVRVVERSSSPLTKYLIQRQDSFAKEIGDIAAKKDLDHLRLDISRLTNRISEFLQSRRQSDTQLVLGRVQSGKTAHMIGLAAWCVDQPVAAFVVLSGSTESLASQTQERFKNETTRIGEKYFDVLEPLPTESSSDLYSSRVSQFVDAVSKRVSGRRDAGEAALPVLTVLKSARRIEALSELLANVVKAVGECDPIVVIDDEADQISQNAKVRKQERTAVNRAIISLRNTGLRQCLVAYTATPQAILLSERNGELQPRNVTVLQPGSAYFGLDDAMAEFFDANRMTLRPVSARVSDSNMAPQELYPAVTQFLISSLVRRLYPEVFFNSGGLKVDFLPNAMVSCQMLIHPSGRQADHEKYRRLVEGCLDSVKRRVSQVVRCEAADQNFASINAEYHNVLSRLTDTVGLPSNLTNLMLSNLSDSLGSSTRTKVVNSDSSRPNADEPLPVSVKDWEQFVNWILIGGDILGRGITIPMLLSTYFLRNPKKSNFDTAVQQMRFCGYRQRFSEFTSIWAPEDVFEMYQVINEVDDVLLRNAHQWDFHGRDLSREKPTVLYLSRPHRRLEPTRKNVIDPGIRDKVIDSSIIFQSRRTFVPGDVRRNSDLVQSTFGGTRGTTVGDGTWTMISDVEASTIQKFLAYWKVGIESPDIRRVSALFDSEFDSLGLGQIPCTVFLRFVDDIEEMSGGRLPIEHEKFAVRSLADPTEGTPEALFEIWKTGFDEVMAGARTMQWYDRNSMKAYVGDSQRRLQQIPSHDAVSVLIEPLRLCRQGSKSEVAIGLALAILAPQSFEVRLMGFDS
jgi:hypothetical protein